MLALGLAASTTRLFRERRNAPAVKAYLPGRGAGTLHTDEYLAASEMRWRPNLHAHLTPATRQGPARVALQQRFNEMP